VASVNLTQLDKPIPSSSTAALRSILSVRSLFGLWHFFVGIVHFFVKIVQHDMLHPYMRIVLSPCLLLWWPFYTSSYTSVLAVLYTSALAVLFHSYNYLVRHPRAQVVFHGYTWLAGHPRTQTVCDAVSQALRMAQYWYTQCAWNMCSHSSDGHCDLILLAAWLLAILRASGFLAIGCSSSKLRLHLYHTAQRHCSMNYRSAKRYCLSCATDDLCDPVLRTTCVLAVVISSPKLVVHMYLTCWYAINYWCHFGLLSTLCDLECDMLTDVACLCLHDLLLARHLCGRYDFVLASPPVLLDEYFAAMLAASHHPCHCETCLNTFGYELRQNQCHYCREAVFNLLATMRRHDTSEPQPEDPNDEVTWFRI
jgi:hypothetical protein